MSSKIAAPVKLKELQECTGCHCHAMNGFVLRDASLSRFVCEDCYTQIASQYPVSKCMVEFQKNAILSVVPEERKPPFQAGYLMGSRENGNGGYKITVKEVVSGIRPGRGTVNFFGKEDILKLRSRTKQTGNKLVGLFRTSPSGSPDFNDLDNKIMEDLLYDVIYVVLGGCSEIQIAVRDKNCRSDEIGVILS